MLTYYKIASGICAIGVLVSIIVMLFLSLPVGAILLIVNLISLGSASKEIEKRERK